MLVLGVSVVVGMLVAMILLLSLSITIPRE